MATRTKISPHVVELRIGIVSDSDLSESDLADVVFSLERRLNDSGGIPVVTLSNKEVAIYPRFHFFGPITQVKL